MTTIFLSGIDTDAGKTYATAYLVKILREQGHKVITQKFIQTGCIDQSEDIVKHRQLLGEPMLPEDLDHTTAPIIFSYPASAQLAARIDGCEVDLSLVDKATARLHENYDTVIVEGAGGLMVPITDDFFTIDYVTSRQLPVALVTNGVLGSINHTILSLEALKSRGVEVRYVIYNTFYDTDSIIAEDTREFIARYLQRHFPEAEYLILPAWK